MQNTDFYIHYRHKKRRYVPYLPPSHDKNINQMCIFCLHFWLRDGSEYGATVVDIEIYVLDLGYGSEI